jgi:hypothetical protein
MNRRTFGGMRAAVVAALVIMTFGGIEPPTPVAAPDDGGLPADAPILGLQTLGSNPTMSFYGVQGTQSLTIPVPPGLLPAELTAIVEIPVNLRAGTVGSRGSWAVGGAVLLVMTIWFYDAPLLAFPLVPAVTTMCVVGGGFFLLARRGAPKRLLDRKVEPLAARQVWAGVPVVVVVAIALAFVPLPPTVGVTAVAAVSGGALRQGEPLIVPPGWHATAERTYDRVHRLCGVGGDLIRQRMIADAVNPQWDKLGRPRTVMVDSITSRRPFSFNVFPARVLYDVAESRLSAPRFVDLGSGVKGQMVSVVDDSLLVTWNAPQFTWGDNKIAQRVSMFAVDNLDPDAPFPEPSGGVLPTLGTVLTILLRGNAAATDRAPTFKDSELLLRLGRALVAAQGVSNGSSP